MPSNLLKGVEVNLKIALVTLLVLASFNESLGQFGRVIYISPDKKLRAVVIPIKRSGGGFHESQITLQSTSGQVIAVFLYGRRDPKDRADVIFGAWSPDSEFFVYNVTISAAHSAWSLETLVYVRSLSQTYNLGYFVGGPVVDPVFSLFGLSRIHGGRLKSDGRLESFQVDLSKIVWTKKK